MYEQSEKQATLQAPPPKTLPKNQTTEKQGRNNHSCGVKPHAHHLIHHFINST